MTPIFQGQPPKTRPKFQPKQWSFGFQVVYNCSKGLKSPLLLPSIAFEMASSMDATDATPMMGPPSTPATTSRMTACCCLKTYDSNLSNCFKDRSNTHFGGMQMYGNIQEFPLQSVLLGLVSYHDPVFWGVESESIANDGGITWNYVFFQTKGVWPQIFDHICY